MTFRELALNHMDERAVWPLSTQEAILTRTINDPSNEAMADRWDDDIEGYPPNFPSIVLYSLRKNAVAWVDENLPEAFWRPLFASDPQPAESTGG
jgi:hypothetical protein